MALTRACELEPVDLRLARLGLGKLLSAQGGELEQVSKVVVHEPRPDRYNGMVAHTDRTNP